MLPFGTPLFWTPLFLDSPFLDSLFFGLPFFGLPFFLDSHFFFFFLLPFFGYEVGANILFKLQQELCNPIFKDISNPKQIA